MKIVLHCVLFLLILGLATGGWAKDKTRTATPRKLIVGVFDAPPFCMKGDDGSWNGISIELWRAIMAELDMDCEFREIDLAPAIDAVENGLIDAVENGLIDAALPALTITSERETYLDFTHPYFVTGLTIAARHVKKPGWKDVMRRILSPTLLAILSLLAIHLFVVGGLVWLFERKRNAEQFGGKVPHGIGAGFWWSAVTMTSVGYGDKAPITFAGRLVAVVWMFTSVVMVASFTAHITTTLTVTHLTPVIRGPADLTNVRVATVSGSTSEVYLQEHFIVYKTFETLDDTIRALENDEVEAVVYDAPILRYLAAHKLVGKIQALAVEFDTQYYGFALQENSPLREPINIALLRLIQEDTWRKTLYKYLGKAE